MKNSFYLKILSLFLILPKILSMEIGNDDIIIISRKPTEIIHINPQLTMSSAEARALEQLTDDLKNKRLNQYQVDRALSNAVALKHRCIMEFLLTPSEWQLRPAQPRINQVLWNAVIADDLILVKYFINRGEEQLRPDQWGMNEALWNGVIYGRESAVERLLNRAEGQLRPDKNGIGHAHKKASEMGNQSILNLLIEALD